MFVRTFLSLIFCSKFLIVICWKPTADYCKIKCPPRKEDHTACSCKLVKPREIIEDNLKDFRQKMINVHNQYRNKIASGGEKDFPEAANMMAVSYSLELEYIAKCHAGVFDSDHDRCRKRASTKTMAGQNLAGHSEISELKNNPDKMAIDWYKEIDEVKSPTDFINKFHLVKYRKGKEPIGHFSQFIWWSVSLVGCARVHNDKIKGAWRNALICNYDGGSVLVESANMQDRQVYKPGTKCTACPGNTSCNSEYPALCGTIAKTTDEKVPLGKPSSRAVLICHNKLILVFVLLVLKTVYSK